MHMHEVTSHTSKQQLIDSACSTDNLRNKLADKDAKNISNNDNAPKIKLTMLSLYETPILIHAKKSCLD